MATRLYLPSSGTAPLGSLAISSPWELTNGIVRLPTSTTKADTTLTTDARLWPAGSTQQWCWWQHQSEPLSAAYDWTTADTVSMVVGRCGEPATLVADTHLAYIVRVVSGDGTVERGTIGLYHATSTEFPAVASAATRIHSARVNGATTFSSQAGDRIIIEIGVHGVTPAAETVQMRFGDPSGTSDFALTAGLTTDLCSWVQLSRDVVFGLVEGSTTATLDTVSPSATSTVSVDGVAAPTLAADTASGTGTTLVGGTADSTLGSLGLVGVGVYGILTPSLSLTVLGPNSIRVNNTNLPDPHAEDWELERNGAVVAYPAAWPYDDGSLDPATEYTYRARGRRSL